MNDRIELVIVYGLMGLILGAIVALLVGLLVKSLLLALIVGACAFVVSNIAFYLCAVSGRCE